MLWCRPMWHIFPRGDHMKIESLRLDFLTLIITKAQNNIRAYQRRKEEKKKKKKTKRTQAVACDPGSVRPRSSHATQAARGPGNALPRSRTTWVARPRAAWAAHVTKTCIFSESLDYFSLRSDGCVLDFLSFLFLCILA